MVVRKIIVLIMAAMFLFLEIYARDDGGRCSVCGKLTMKGSSHICKSRKKIRYRTISRPVTTDKKMVGKDGNEKKNLNRKNQKNTDFAYLLPLLKVNNYEEIRVRGVAINPKMKNAQLISDKRYYSIVDGMDISEEPAASYYDKYCADIPVLGVVGSHGEVNDDLKNAVDQLNERKQSSTSRLKKLMKEAESNYRKYQTPLYCLAATDPSVVTSALSRVWKNKKGKKLDGVWIADYESYNVDGVIILSKGKKTLQKVSISALCDEDVKFINETRLNADAPRFAFKKMSIPKGTELDMQFRYLDKKGEIEAVVFAKGSNSEGEKVQYIQLSPNGQICMLPIEDETVSSYSNASSSYYKRPKSYKSTTSADSSLYQISSEEASNGLVALLEKLIFEGRIESYTLPKLEYSNNCYEVLGVVINLESKSPQLICRSSKNDRNNGGNSLNGCDRSDNVMVDLKMVSEAKAYYDMHCAVIPLLGFYPSKPMQDGVSKEIKDMQSQLALSRKEARKEIRNLKMACTTFGLPLEYIVNNYKVEQIDQIAQEWTMKNGKKINGVWIANYCTNNIRGVVIYERESCKMKKIPLADFSEKDQKIIKEMNTHVPRFECMRISIPEESKMSYQCKCIGADIKNFDAIILGKEEKSGYERLKAGTESALYVLIFPDGQICKLELDDKMIKGNMFGESLGELKKYDDLKQVKQGPIYELAERARKKLSSLIYDERYAEYAYERSNPELSCKIHKWQEKYAPKYNGDYYTNQQKAEWEQNYKLALLAQKDGKERCTCKDSNVESIHNKAKEAWIEACDKRRDFERREPIYKFMKSENL